MIISTFTSQQDNQPARGEATWAQLIEGLATPTAAACTVSTCAGKTCPHKAGFAWSPAYWPEGATRGAATLEAVSLLVVDLDDVDPEAMLPILEPLLVYRLAIHASHSDRTDSRRFRLLLDLSRPVLAREFKVFWRAAMTVLRLPGDEQAKDASRLFFLPSRPHDACHTADDGTGYMFHAQEGAALDVDAILATAPAMPAPAPMAPGEMFVVPEFTGAPSSAQLHAAATALGEAWPDEGRHGAQLALAGALARAGWPVELIADFCAAIAEVQQPGNAMRDKRMTAARSSVDKVLAGDAVAGWPTVIEYVGEDAVQAARTALGFEVMPQEDLGFVAAMTTLAARVKAEEVAATPAPTAIEFEAKVKEAQRTLARRRDADALRDCELLKRVLRGEPLSEGGASEQERQTTLALATLAVVRSAPTGTQPDQLIRLLTASAGFYAKDLPEVIARATAQAAQMPSILARSPGHVGQRVAPAGNGQPDGDAPLDEFVLEQQGPRQGRPVSNSDHNMRVALNRLGIRLNHNLLSGEEEMVRDGVRCNIEDHHLRKLRNDCERQFDLKPSKDELWDLVSVVAHESPYHPVLDYFDGLVDTGSTDLTETWLIRCAGAEDTPYTRAVSRLLLVAAVRRVRSPGCKFDEMVILETTAQGKSKSLGLRTLAVSDKWFTDDFSLQNDSKKNMEQTQGRWIIEAGELRGMSAGDHNALKQYLSRQSDRARMAYDRKVKEMPRQFIIVGTTNDAQYLKDNLNRRYWPIKVVEFDVAALTAIRDQLWAEAVRLERENPDANYIRLDSSLWQAAAEQQAMRRVDSPYEVVLDDALGGAVGRILVQDAWKLLGHDDQVPTWQQTNQIGVAMQSLGFERQKYQHGGVRKYWYVRGEGPERDIVLRVVGQGGGSGYKVRVENAAPLPPQRTPTPEHPN